MRGAGGGSSVTDFTRPALADGGRGLRGAAGSSGTVATLCAAHPASCQARAGVPRALRGVLGAALPSPAPCFPGTPGWELLGQGWEPARSRLSGTVLGTQGASHGVILPLPALAKIPMEPLGIPGHGLALLRGNSSAITCRHRERPRPSWCHSAALGGAFCGYSSAHQKTSLSPKIGCSHPLLVKNLDSG